jgi:hypothetical protein
MGVSEEIRKQERGFASALKQALMMAIWQLLTLPFRHQSGALTPCDGMLTLCQYEAEIALGSRLPNAWKHPKHGR